MMCKIVCTVLNINPKESLSEAHEEQLAAAYYIMQNIAERKTKKKRLRMMVVGKGPNT